MLLRASHSAEKLLDAPWKLRLNTLIAIGFVSNAIVPLYTVPNDPEPTKLVEENQFVALTMSSYDTFSCSLKSCADGYALLRFKRTTNKQDSNIAETAHSGISIFSSKDLEVLLELSEQRGRPSIGAPAHNLLFPWTDTLLAFAKTPVDGTPPLKSLKDKFKYCKALSDVSICGILQKGCFEKDLSL